MWSQSACQWTSVVTFTVVHCIPNSSKAKSPQSPVSSNRTLIDLRLKAWCLLCHVTPRLHDQWTIIHYTVLHWFAQQQQPTKWHTMEIQTKAVDDAGPGLMGLQDSNAFRIIFASQKVVRSWPSLRLRLLSLLWLRLVVMLKKRSHAGQMGLLKSQFSAS